MEGNPVEMVLFPEFLIGHFAFAAVAIAARQLDVGLQVTATAAERNFVVLLYVLSEEVYSTVGALGTFPVRYFGVLRLFRGRG